MNSWRGISNLWKEKSLLKCQKLFACEVWVEEGKCMSVRKSISIDPLGEDNEEGEDDIESGQIMLDRGKARGNQARLPEKGYRGCILKTEKQGGSQIKEEERLIVRSEVLRCRLG